MRTMLLTLVIVICGCAAKPLAPGAEKVFLSNDKPSAECEYLGEVNGSQGNYLTAELTTHNAAAKGARNEIRNKAFELDADYVHVQQFSHSADDSGGTSATIIGHAYKCR